MSANALIVFWCCALTSTLIIIGSFECRNNAARDDRNAEPVSRANQFSHQFLPCDRDTAAEECVLSNAFALSKDFEYHFGSANGSSLPEKKRIQFVSSTLKWIPSRLLSAFPNVETLRLEALQTETFERDAFANGSSIKRLHLADNDISALHDDAFDDLRTVEHISIDGNRLTFLPPTIFQQTRRLRSITLARNYLQRIAEGLFRFTVDLKYLDVSHNAIEFFDLTQIPSLIEVDVSFNVLSNVTISQNVTLLNASHNRIRQVAGWSRKLRVLTVAHNHMGQVGWVQQFPGLAELDLSFNELQDLEDEPFSRLVHLQILLLNNNQLFTVELPASLPMLRVLDLSHNHLVSLDSIANLLNKLQVLSLHHNSLVTLELAGGSTLESVSLSHNDWDCESLRALQSALSKTGAPHVQPEPDNCTASAGDSEAVCCRKTDGMPYLERLTKYLMKSDDCFPECAEQCASVNSVQDVSAVPITAEPIGPASENYQQLQNELSSMSRQVFQLSQLQRNVERHFRTTAGTGLPSVSEGHAEFVAGAIAFLKQRNQRTFDAANNRSAEAASKRTQIDKLEQEVVALQAMYAEKRTLLYYLHKNKAMSSMNN